MVTDTTRHLSVNGLLNQQWGHIACVGSTLLSFRGVSQREVLYGAQTNLSFGRSVRVLVVRQVSTDGTSRNGFNSLTGHQRSHVGRVQRTGLSFGLRGNTVVQHRT
ncbi:hypothetical protein D3C86_1279180 [compost metagenome]